ncbi:MAG: FRG domain-containing protein [Phycisphaerales bacterium]
MLRIDSESWGAFEEDLREFFDQSPIERRRFVFRGQADASWGLDSTVQRIARKQPGLNITSFSRRLIEEFQTESAKASVDVPAFDHDEAWGLLARHHSLPSDILDWTRSPYVAQFFAASDEIHAGPNPPARSAIWGLDLGVLDKNLFEAFHPFSVIERPSLVPRNPRASEQQSVFLRVAPDWERHIGHDLVRWTFPAKDRHRVLVRLESMGITHASLMRTLDAAATTAMWRAAKLERNNDE